MATETILAQIDAEIERLTRVRTLLAGTGKAVHTAKKEVAKAAPKKARKKRVLSAEARKKIADAQRKRWAKARKGA
ncbi:MAG: hypothetical protein KGN79_06155 [Acidobacteriota bacterium]|nr:hypothetical protein [Acidobacteriota bacterium]